MSALLAEVSQRLDEEQRWVEVKGAYERLQREDPEGWQDYLAELAELDHLAGDGLADAREDWPEFNK